MNIVPETTAQRRSALGFCVMTIVPLLQLATEYLGTGDRGRTLSKLAVSIIGLPILICGSSAGLRWAAGRRLGPLVLLIGGALSAGTLYALLLYAMHLASLSIAMLRPGTGAWAASAALRIGFAMGLTNFGLWALAFVFPFALEDARIRALEAQQLRTQKEHFRALAEADGLTGLPNFRSFRARIEEEVARAVRYGQPLACAMMDLDGLKEINDRLGHAAGNRAILALADAVREELRETDFAARYGGDEFVVLLPQTSAQAAELFADRLRWRLLEVSDEAGLRVRASIGVAALFADEVGSQEAAEDLLRCADEELYKAKRASNPATGGAPRIRFNQSDRVA